MHTQPLLAVVAAVVVASAAAATASQPQSHTLSTRCAACHALLQTRFGENVALVGSFCSWDPAAATPLSWSDGGVWTAETELPVGQEVSYKFIVKGEDAVTWQPCPNLTLTLADGTKVRPGVATMLASMMHRLIAFLPALPLQTVLVLDDWLGKTHEVQPVEEEEEAEVAAEVAASPEEAAPATAAAVVTGDLQVAAAAAAAAVEIPVEEEAVAVLAVVEEEEPAAAAAEAAAAPALLLEEMQPVVSVAAEEVVAPVSVLLAAAPTPSPLAALAAFRPAAPSSSTTTTTKAAPGKRSSAAAGPKAPRAPKASQLTVKDIKAQLQALGLSVAGRKEELVARLKDATEL